MLSGYDDDTTQIPRSTTVVARRLAAARPGVGKAARYVTGKMPVNAKNAHRIESSRSAAASKGVPAVNASTLNSNKEMTEEEKLQALLSANDQFVKAEQENMSHKPVVRSNFNRTAAVPDKPPGPDYICHRCGQPGHWIRACPTNNDPNFEGRPRFKRTTGIPRSRQKIIEKPTELDENGNPDLSKLPKGAMCNAEGQWVVAEDDHATWEKIQDKQNAAAAKAKEAEVDEAEIRERGLECSLHKGIIVQPVKTPCCGTTYCSTCIEDELANSDDLTCPKCGKQALIDDLVPDEEMTTRIAAYQDEKKLGHKAKGEEQTTSPKATGSAKGESPPAVGPEVKVNGTTSPASTPNSKKRSAQEELPNDRKPSQPALSHTRTSSKQGTPIPTQPSSSTTALPKAPTAPAADIAGFQKQMQAMSASIAGAQNGMPSMMDPTMMNPMMNGYHPAMMGMNPMMGAGPMMNPQNFNNMQSMTRMGGWNGQQMMGQNGWQGGNLGGGGQNNGPYMQQPVNPNNNRGRYGRPRSADYRQL